MSQVAVISRRTECSCVFNIVPYPYGTPVKGRGKFDAIGSELYTQSLATTPMHIIWLCPSASAVGSN
jgi:hypothetical protein